MYTTTSRRLFLLTCAALMLLAPRPPLADEPVLLSIGPRFGFSGKSPFLGKEQKYNFHLIDVAAVFRLPWSWRLGESPWTLETRLLTSAGVLGAAGENGVMATVVPLLAVSGWDRFVSLDAGAGAAAFTRERFGIQDFGGPVQIVATIGFQINPIPHTYAGFRLHHFSDAGAYGPNTLGVDMYIIELGYRF
jgi:hypothetical protein